MLNEFFNTCNVYSGRYIPTAEHSGNLMHCNRTSNLNITNRQLETFEVKIGI